MSGVPNAGAAAAAARAARIAREEEEHMTPYSAQDLQEGWEFKILRSTTGAFRRPDVLRRVCDEEARAGWQLVEKFDSSRLRFKRPASARANDGAFAGDPYRTEFGLGQVAFALLIVFSIFAVLGTIFAIVALFRQAR